MSIFLSRDSKIFYLRYNLWGLNLGPILYVHSILKNIKIKLKKKGFWWASTSTQWELGNVVFINGKGLLVDNQ